jgi:hypothetical protein
MRYLVIDAMLYGTGIRDKYESGYLAPKDLGISIATTQRLNIWLSKYENEHYNGFINDDTINELDKEGKEIALQIKSELSEVKLEYFSDARMISELI